MSIELPGVGLVRPQQTGVEVSMAAAGAPWEALGEFGKIVQSLGDKATNLIVEAKRDDIETRSNKMQLELTKEFADYENQLIEQNVDPKQWMPGLDKLIADRQKQWVDPKMSRDEQAILGGKFDELALRSRLSMGKSATLAIRSNLELSIGNTLNEAERVDDEDLRQTAFAQLARIRRPEEVARVRAESDRRVEVNRVEGLIDDDPREAKSLLSSTDFLTSRKGVTSDDQRKLLKSAEMQIQNRQARALKMVSEGIESGKFQSEDSLKEELSKLPDIDASLHDEVLWNFSQSQPIDSETKFELTDQLNDLHDAYKAGDMSFDDYRLAHAETAQIVYALGSRDGTGALRQRVHALDPANWNEGRNLKDASRKDSLQRSMESISKLYAEEKAFGQVDEDAEPAERAQQAVDALDRRSRVEKQMTQWIEQNPEATEDDVSKRYRKAYMDELTGPILAPTLRVSPDRRRADLVEILGVAKGPKGAKDDTPDKPIGGDLKSMVKEFEAGGAPGGFHSEAYEDYGQYSIGFGSKAKKGEVIDMEEAERRLDAELSEHRRIVVREAERVGIKFEGHELDALTSFSFNTGKIEQLLAGGTRSKAEIASKMLLYRKAGGKRLRGLERRRIAEAHLFRRGYDK